jgi:uncharacterized protein YidB (DUF937 family)
MTAPNADLVQQHLGDDGIAQLTQHLGVDSGTAKAAAAAALPMIVQAMNSRSSAPGTGAAASGMGAGLGGLVGGLGGLFGGNHAEAAQQVSHKTGLDMHNAEKALLFLAPLVLAKFAQQRQQAAPAGPTPAAQPPAAPNAAGTAGAAPATPQADGDSVVDKVMGAVEKIFHR